MRVRRSDVATPLRAGRALSIAVALSSSVAFLLAAALRRLNFDEALALRAGFLSLSHIPGEPPFAMPFTVALGALGRAVSDPGVVFLAARIAVAASVLGALHFALRRASGDAATAALAGTLTLLQATFFVHGLEFRYDAAILVAMLIALPLLTRGGDRDLLLVGVLSAWLSAHHLKGAVLGLALVGLAAVRARGRPSALQRVLLGVVVAAGGWIAVSAALGILPDVLKVYASFAQVAATVEIRLGPWQALSDTFRRDAIWWLVALGAVGATLYRFRGRTLDEEVAFPDLWALALGAVSLGVLPLHPHPWPYMLAVPAPFLSFLAARRFLEIPSLRGRLVAGAAVAALFTVEAFTRSSPVPAFVASFTERREAEVANLRLLRRVARPGDRVVDPSGLAYFLPPCTTQWYIDSLFREGARKGTWMGEMAFFDPAACPLLLETYRLNMLPFKARDRLARNYVVVSGAVGLWVGDHRVREAASWPSLPAGPLDSFW
ncbi:MAG: hypothetical protein ACM3JH_05225 [Acidithiobacillales bacterium]